MVADILSQGGILSFLNEELRDKLIIDIRETIGSTNEEIKALSHMPEGYALFAANQTKGKGRLGRAFYSPDSTGVYFSLLLKPQLPPEKALGITTAAAVAVCRALEKLGAQPSIKWVNDIFISGKKVCGILTESAFSGNGNFLSYAILGIGINVYAPEEGFPEELRKIAGAVFETRRENLKNRLCAEIINEFFSLYDGIGNDAHSEEYERRNFVIGKKATVVKNDELIDVTVDGITPSCGLMVTYENGEKAVLSTGEISLKAEH